MRRLGVFFVVVSLLLLALPVVGQVQPGPILRFYHIKPKAGMEQQFEEAYKRHLDWHRQQNDTWTWVMWQVEAGERFGQYTAVTGSHRWEDFDARGELGDADSADAMAKLSPYVESVTSSFSRSHSDISRPPASEDSFPLLEVTSFQLNPGSAPAFTHVVRKVHEAIVKTNRPVHYFWEEVVSGGEEPMFSVVIPQKNWADLEPLEKSIGQMLEEVYGREEAESLRKTFWKSVHSQRTVIVRYRADLSYIPGQ